MVPPFSSSSASAPAYGWSEATHGFTNLNGSVTEVVSTACRSNNTRQKKCHHTPDVQQEHPTYSKDTATKHNTPAHSCSPLHCWTPAKGIGIAAATLHQAALVGKRTPHAGRSEQLSTCCSLAACATYTRVSKQHALGLVDNANYCKVLGQNCGSQPLLCLQAYSQGHESTSLHMQDILFLQATLNNHWRHP
jgi:hypothetical protein